MIRGPDFWKPGRIIPATGRRRQADRLAEPLAVVAMSNPFRYYSSSPKVIRFVVIMYVRPSSNKRGVGYSVGPFPLGWNVAGASRLDEGLPTIRPKFVPGYRSTFAPASKAASGGTHSKPEN